PNGPLTVYTHWAVISNSDTLTNESGYFMNIVLNNSMDNAVRSLAAYALRHVDHLTQKDWNKLAEKALSETYRSDVHIYLLSAAFVTAPEDAIQTVDYSNIHNALLGYKNSQNENEVVEMTAALAEKGHVEDLPVLISFLKEKDSN